ncbi:unnamed protein product, partial [Laminaria digitata]
GAGASAAATWNGKPYAAMGGGRLSPSPPAGSLYNVDHLPSLSSRSSSRSPPPPPPPAHQRLWDGVIAPVWRFRSSPRTPVLLAPISAVARLCGASAGAGAGVGGVAARGSNSAEASKNKKTDKQKKR